MRVRQVSLRILDAVQVLDQHVAAQWQTVHELGHAFLRGRIDRAAFGPCAGVHPDG
jgi:hypothetical protein